MEEILEEVSGAGEGSECPFPLPTLHSELVKPWDNLYSPSRLPAPCQTQGMAPSLVCPQLHRCGQHWAPGGTVGPERTGVAEAWLRLQGSTRETHGACLGLHTP